MPSPSLPAASATGSAGGQLGIAKRLSVASVVAYAAHRAELDQLFVDSKGSPAGTITLGIRPNGSVGRFVVNTYINGVLDNTYTFGTLNDQDLTYRQFPTTGSNFSPDDRVRFSIDVYNIHEELEQTQELETFYPPLSLPTPTVSATAFAPTPTTGTVALPVASATGSAGAHLGTAKRVDIAASSGSALTLQVQLSGGFQIPLPVASASGSATQLNRAAGVPTAQGTATAVALTPVTGILPIGLPIVSATATPVGLSKALTLSVSSAEAAAGGGWFTTRTLPVAQANATLPAFTPIVNVALPVASANATAVFISGGLAKGLPVASATAHATLQADLLTFEVVSKGSSPNTITVRVQSNGFVDTVTIRVSVNGVFREATGVGFSEGSTATADLVFPRGAGVDEFSANDRVEFEAQIENIYREVDRTRFLYSFYPPISLGVASGQATALLPTVSATKRVALPVAEASSGIFDFNRAKPIPISVAIATATQTLRGKLVLLPIGVATALTLDTNFVSTVREGTLVWETLVMYYVERELTVHIPRGQMDLKTLRDSGYTAEQAAEIIIEAYRNGDIKASGRDLKYYVEVSTDMDSDDEPGYREDIEF